MNAWAEFGDIATAVAALATVGVLVFNFLYMREFHASIKLQKKSVGIQDSTAQASILLQINNQFFYQHPHKKIIDLLENELPIFANGVSETELDDHIGMLDTLGTFLKERILTRERWVWALFSHYVESVYECKEISDYIAWCQENLSKTIFEDFIWLYGEMKTITRNREQGRSPGLP